MPDRSRRVPERSRRHGHPQQVPGRSQRMPGRSQRMPERSRSLPERSRRLRPIFSQSLLTFACLTILLGGKATLRTTTITYLSARLGLGIIKPAIEIGRA